MFCLTQWQIFGYIGEIFPKGCKFLVWFPNPLAAGSQIGTLSNNLPTILATFRYLRTLLTFFVDQVKSSHNSDQLSERLHVFGQVSSVLMKSPTGKGQ